MQSVDNILETIDANADTDEIRSDIADLLVECLTKVQDSFGYWEKAHLAHAIADLSRNINSKHQPTTMWLRLCLITIEKAMVPANQRDEHYTPRDAQLDALTFEHLMDEIKAIRGGA